MVSNFCIFFVMVSVHLKNDRVQLKTRKTAGKGEEVTDFLSFFSYENEERK